MTEDDQPASGFASRNDAFNSGMSGSGEGTNTASSFSGSADPEFPGGYAMHPAAALAQSVRPSRPFAAGSVLDAGQSSVSGDGMSEADSARRFFGSKAINDVLPTSNGSSESTSAARRNIVSTQVGA